MANLKHQNKRNSISEHYLMFEILFSDIKIKEKCARHSDKKITVPGQLKDTHLLLFTSLGVLDSYPINLRDIYHIDGPHEIHILENIFLYTETNAI